MKLGSLQVHRPSSVAQALETMGRYGDDAAFFAGGTELLLVMKLGLAEYAHLIDLKRVEELSHLSAENGDIRIGATATYRQVETDQELRAIFPSFVRMVSGIGNLRVRSTGTLGGNLAFADPHSDPLTFLMAAGATVDLIGAGGFVRSLPVEELTIAPYITQIEPEEILAAIRVPSPAPGRRFVHRHVRFRERPALTVTAAADVSASGMRNVRLVIGALTGVPVSITEAERMIEEEGSVDPEAVRGAVSDAVDPIDDLDGSADYKRHLAGVYAERALRALVADDGGETWS